MGNENSVQGIQKGGFAMERRHQETWKGELLTGEYKVGSFNGNWIVQHV